MIIPAILTDSIEFLQSELDRFSQLNPAPQRVQVDIIDGEFADELTVEPNFLQSVDPHGILVDVHLMTMEPQDVIEEFWGDKRIATIIGQVERMTSLQEFVDRVHDGGWKAGLSLDYYTPFSALDEVDLAQVDVVQIMGAPAGKQGEVFKEGALAVITEAAQWKKSHGLKFEIFVDIGMNDVTVPQVLAAGATGCVVGSYLQTPEAQARWEHLRKVDHGA